MTRVPTQLDRYPAKMVPRLASSIFDRYGIEHTSNSSVRVLDPFCGSGAVLVEAAKRGVAVSGSDISPFATLLSEAKLGPFDAPAVIALVEELVNCARRSSAKMSFRLPRREHWFGPIAIDHIERLRAQAKKMKLIDSLEGRIVVLAIALSMRLCSFADQRSPKPFISKHARAHRVGKCFDPFQIVQDMAGQLAQVYSHEYVSDFKHNVHNVDITKDEFHQIEIGWHSHVLTSPPYINAQDYFRNSKFELYAIEGIIAFDVGDIRGRFVGTERVGRVPPLSQDVYSYNNLLVPHLVEVERHSRPLAEVVQRYLYSMRKAFVNITKCLRPNGKLFLVCGDNIVAGVHICTWEVLAKMLGDLRYQMFDCFSDEIKNRHVPPIRKGHKALIKEEVVCAFELKA